MNVRLVLGILIVVALQWPAAVRAAPATQPAVDPLMKLTADAVRAGDLSGLADILDQQAKAMMASPENIDPARAKNLAVYWEFAHYFGSLRMTPDQKQTLEWLAGQGRLCSTLMAAVADSIDQPDKVVQLLSVLQGDEDKTLNGYADLTTAFLIVWDKPLDPGFLQAVPVPGNDPQHVLRLFHYYINAKSHLRFDLHDLPWQLAVYVVDNRLSEDEMVWVLDRYGNRSPIGPVYFDVPYDTSYFLNGGTKKISQETYTLPNLLKDGGVCIDQAYFATQVARTLGIPACICTGESGAGQYNHAWLGVLEVPDGKAVWKFDEGRYKEDLFWSANIEDPQFQSREYTVTDADLALSAELQNVKPEARLESSLLLKLAAEADEKNRVVLVMRAIDLCPGNHLAWMALARLGLQGKLSDEQRVRIGQVVQRYLVKPYPDFACWILVRVGYGQGGDAAIDSMSRIAEMFPDRPDLKARLLILKGNMLHEAHEDDKAMLAYGEVLTDDLNAGPIIENALNAVDHMLRGRNDLGKLVKIYDQVWHQMPKPEPSAHAAETAYFEEGKKYADLLEQTGDTNGADTVKQELAKLLGPTR